MGNRLGFIKTTVVGGFVFLIPAVIVVVALGKLIGALKVLAKALSPLFGIESFTGGLVLELFAFTVTVLLCFVAGFVARRASAHAGKTGQNFVELLSRIRLYQRVC
jgi:uncharacterized membrane protein